jgi:VIT1/CCC1 family predicted Fe2+/Mn2+ transporter
VLQSEVVKELQEMERSPDFERRELALIYQQDGVAPEDAQLLVKTLARYPRAYQKAMVANELGINTLEPETVKLPEALTIGGAYLGGSVFPLIAYFFFKPVMALPISLVLTFVALVVVGIVKGKLASMNLFRSIVEIVVVGLLSAGGGYVLGTFIPRMFGY